MIKHIIFVEIFTEIKSRFSKLTQRELVLRHARARAHLYIFILNYREETAAHNQETGGGGIA